MNFGWLDAHNFAWKFHLVEAGFLRRSVLKTYEDERRFMAAKLIDFDSRYSALFSTRIRGLGQSNGEKAPVTNGHTIEKDEFKELYKQNSEFTGGYAVDYGQSCLTLDPSHLTCPDVVLTLNGRLQLGRIFPTATVNRVYDARVCHLEQEVPLNGSFRIYLFSGEPTANRPSILKFASDLVKPTSFFTRYQNNVRLDYEDRHTPHSKFFTFCIIFSCARSQLDANKMLPGVLAAYKYQFYADDAGERVGTVHEKFGIDATKGGAVVVRPDGHVACAFALEEGTVCAMDEYFGSICTMGEE